MDGFESFADKMAANDPLLKLEGQNILDSPVMCALERNNWLEDKDFSTFVTSSLPGFEPPKSTGSINDVGLVAEELKIKHYRISSSGPDPDNDQRMLRVRGELKDMPSHTRSFKVLSSNHSEQEPDKLSAYLRDQESKIMSNNMLNIAKKKLKTQSNNSHSQLLVNETSKGKRLSKLGYDSEVDVNNDQFSSHGVGNSGPNSVRYGISLREWLIPGNHKVDIVESLLIFRQIVELVDFAHSQGVALQDLRPSRFMLLPSNKVKYTGSSTIRESSVSIINRDLIIKRPLEQDARAERISGGRPMKQSEAKAEIFCVAGPQNSGYGEGQFQTKSSYQNAVVAVQKRSISVIIQLEEKWYTSPEEHNERGCTLPSNIYGLGVLLFELLCRSESWELHSAMMLDLHHRVLPQKFLSQNPQEAGFCFWLLHPEPLSRPTTREILQSKMIGRYQDTASSAEFSNSVGDVDAESELLLNFLVSLKDKKQGHASKLVEDIRTLEEDINKFARRHLSGVSSDISWVHDEIPREREESLIPDSVSSGYSTDEKRLMKNIGQLEDAYASARSQLAQIEAAPVASSDNEVLNNRDRWCHMRNGTQDTSINRMKSGDRLGSFFDGFCKFSRHSKFEVCGTLRNGNLLNSSNVICCLSFDRGEEYIATAGVSKKIKIFDFGKLVDNSLDIHYPVVEIPNNSKLSCVCWNNYLKNYLASADYDGVVQMWDATTGQGFSQHVEHQKRAWSVDFSQSDPKVFASGSDDFSVKLWDINEKNSTSTIWNPANVCCVQFSAYSSNLLVFGSADYKIYGYDLRHTRIPWCTLPGHGKAVSYVKFIDSETLVSASTDNTLKLWDLNQSISTGLSSNACSRTFSGHTNQKNFVGLSVSDGYIACGSETNEVYSYHRSLPMPITSHKFGSIDPISGSEVIDYSGQFVSSVCWRRKSNMVVAANSSGTLKILQMV